VIDFGFKKPIPLSII